MAADTAAPFVPPTGDLDELGAAAASCTGCPLDAAATQTVFGEGARHAALMLVGEQPGEAGIRRDDVYTTNAVKHFKHEVRGKRRLHKKPGTAEIDACHPWLTAEVEAVRPRVIVALGAVAARSLLGRTVGIAASRGNPQEVGGVPLYVTYHPSAVLRADERAKEVRAALVEDLRPAWQRSRSETLP